MTDTPPPPSPVPPPPSPLPPTADVVPVASAHRSRWIGLVWAVPLAALLIVGFLGARSLADRGTEVVVTFDTGGNAHVDDTKVMYQGIEIGKVTRIEMNPDGRHVDMTLRLDRHADHGLTSTAVFWLVGANPSINDISSVKAALAGVAIGYAPGTGGTPAHKFTGLSEPPIVLPGTPGTPYVLTAGALATASVGSAIYYRGLQIGKVTGVHFVSAGSFALDIFIQAPFDKLVDTSASFWVSSPVQVSLAERGASASLEHAGALFNGAIEFDRFAKLGASPATTANAAQRPPRTEFTLYANKDEAQTGPTGPEVAYTLRFTGPAGELSAGAPIRLMGFPIGEVKSSRLDLDPATGAASTAVVAVLYPRKLHVREPARDDPADWQRATDQVVDKLLATGHRVRLVQTPPLIGSRALTFDVVRDADRRVALGAERRLPSEDSSGGIDEITGQVSELLGRLNRIPLDAIGRDVQQLSARLNALVSSPQLANSLTHLNQTLAQADHMMGEVAPQVGPLVAKLNRAADEVTSTVAAAHGLIGSEGAAANANLPGAIQELSDAARSIRALADYLGRHPESLLRGRSATTDATKGTP